MLSASKRSGRKVGGRCRSKVLNVRTGPRRVFADAAEVAKRAEAKRRPEQQLLSVRPKPVMQVTFSKGHKVVSLVRLPEVVQLLKSRR